MKRKPFFRGVILTILTPVLFSGCFTTFALGGAGIHSVYGGGQTVVVVQPNVYVTPLWYDYYPVDSYIVYDPRDFWQPEPVFCFSFGFWFWPFSLSWTFYDPWDVWYWDPWFYSGWYWPAPYYPPVGFCYYPPVHNYYVGSSCNHYSFYSTPIERRPFPRREFISRSCYDYSRDRYRDFAREDGYPGSDTRRSFDGRGETVRLAGRDEGFVRRQDPIKNEQDFGKRDQARRTVIPSRTTRDIQQREDQKRQSTSYSSSNATRVYQLRTGTVTDTRQTVQRRKDWGRPSSNTRTPVNAGKPIKRSVQKNDSGRPAPMRPAQTQRIPDSGYQKSLSDRQSRQSQNDMKRIYPTVRPSATRQAPSPGNRRSPSSGQYRPSQPGVKRNSSPSRPAPTKQSSPSSTGKAPERRTSESSRPNRSSGDSRNSQQRRR